MFVNENSTVRIIGFSDNVGPSKTNLKISQKRAESTAKSIAHSNMETIGLGEEHDIYPFQTPEGRMYARTVKVIIETPIENKD